MSDQKNIISIKNINALLQTVRELTERSFTYQIQLNNINNTIYTLTQRIAELETMLLIQKVKSIGHGATVK